MSSGNVREITARTCPFFLIGLRTATCPPEVHASPATAPRHAGRAHARKSSWTGDGAAPTCPRPPLPARATSSPRDPAGRTAAWLAPGTSPPHRKPSPAAFRPRGGPSASQLHAASTLHSPPSVYLVPTKLCSRKPTPTGHGGWPRALATGAPTHQHLTVTKPRSFCQRGAGSSRAVGGYLAPTASPHRTMSDFGEVGTLSGTAVPTSPTWAGGAIAHEAGGGSRMADIHTDLLHQGRTKLSRIHA